MTPREKRRRAKRRPDRTILGFSQMQWPFVLVLVGNWAFAIAFILGVKLFVTWEPSAWDTVGDKLALVIQDAVYAVLPAVIAIGVVAVQRLNPDMWVGKSVKPNSALEINTRFIVNTFEQFTLYLVAHAAMALYAPAQEARSLPIMTVLFLMGRVLFWIGYHRNAYLRAFGFGLTFYPTVGGIVWVLLVMLFGIRVPI